MSQVVVSRTAIRVGQHDAVASAYKLQCKASSRWVHCQLIDSTCIMCFSFLVSTGNPSLVSVAVTPQFQYECIGTELAMSVPVY